VAARQATENNTKGTQLQIGTIPTMKGSGPNQSSLFSTHPPTANRITLMEKHIKTVISTRAKGCASSINATISPFKSRK